MILSGGDDVLPDRLEVGTYEDDGHLGKSSESEDYPSQSDIPEQEDLSKKFQDIISGSGAILLYHSDESQHHTIMEVE